MRVLLETPTGELSGILTVFSVIGDHRPSSAVEGVTPVVPGVINFSHSAGGENAYIQAS
jgi:hypothetical protein